MVLLFVGTAALLVSVLVYRHATTAEARRREVRIRLEEARRAFSPAEAEVTLEDAVRSVGDRSRAEGTERSEEHTSELQSRQYLVCRLLLEKTRKCDTPRLSSS